MDRSNGLDYQDGSSKNMLELVRELARAEDVESIVNVVTHSVPAKCGAQRCIIALIPTELSKYVSRLLQNDHLPHGCGMHCCQDLPACACATAPPQPLYEEYEAIAASCPLFSQCASLSSIERGLFAPISVGGQLLGAIGYEYIENSAIGSAERIAAESISFFIGQAVERIYIKNKQRESEMAIRRFIKAQSMTHVGNWEHDLASNVIAWSDEMFHIMEFDPRGDVPQLDDVLSLYHGEVIEQREEPVRQNGSVNTPGEFDIRLTMPDGREKWIHTVNQVESDDEGNVIRQYGTTTDITERKEFEQTQSRLIAIVEDSTDFIATADMQGNLLYCNAAMRRLLGISEDEVTKHTVRDIHSAESWTKFSPHIPVFNADINWTGECEFVSRDGRKVPVSLKMLVHSLEGGRILYRSGIGRDISTQKAHTSELDLARTRLHQALEIAHIGSWELDVSTGSVWLSREFSQLMGSNDEECVIDLQQLLSTYSPDDRQRLESALKVAITTGRGYELEITRTCSDGMSRCFQARGKPIKDETGAVAKVVHTFMDITQQRELESHLMHIQKMESIGTFAGAIAHDFNNLLTIIQGYTEQSTEALEADDPVQQYLCSVTSAAERAASLTKQLLAFAHRQPVTPDVFVLNALVENMDRMLVSIVGPRIRIQIDLDPDAGAVYVDSNNFEQILLNLVVNARDAMPEGGELLIKTSTTENMEEDRIPVLSGGKYAVLTVKDTGTGIPDAIKSRIFEPFFTTKAKGNGTGLGLSTVFSIVRESGGHIELDSAMGEGAEFRVYLPFIDRPVEQGAGVVITTTPAPKLTHSTVLVVDDEPLLRSLMVTALERRGYHVLQAADGQAALQMLADDRSAIDLLVTDVMMPIIGGIELARQFSETRPGVPVLLISGFTDEIFNGHGAAIGDLPFLQKPFRMKELTERVKQIIQTANILHGASVTW